MIAVGNAIGYAEHYSRSQDAVIYVHDLAANVIETLEHANDFKKSGELAVTSIASSNLSSVSVLRGRSPGRSELSARAHHEQQNGARVL